MYSVHRADTVAVECIPSPATMVILTPRYTRILHAVYCIVRRSAVWYISCVNFLGRNLKINEVRKLG